jgi:hypothetical protein
MGDNIIGRRGVPIAPGAGEAISRQAVTSRNMIILEHLLVLPEPGGAREHRMKGNNPAPELQLVIENLPAGFDTLRAEARAEGHSFCGTACRRLGRA